LRILLTAFERAQAVYGPIDRWYIEDYEKFRKRFSERLTEFMKISKDNGDYSYILADGTLIGDLNYSASTNFGQPFEYDSNWRGVIEVDIDGKNKGKNQLGTDIFVFDVITDGIFPEQLLDESQCFAHGYCTRWVIENENMDYLKAGSDGKCPNGVQLSWTQTSCK